jgi:hypothetical protein
MTTDSRKINRRNRLELPFWYQDQTVIAREDVYGIQLDDRECDARQNYESRFFEFNFTESFKHHESPACAEPVETKPVETPLAVEHDMGFESHVSYDKDIRFGDQLLPGNVVRRKVNGLVLYLSFDPSKMFSPLTLRSIAEF